ncbi:double zinc ribbon domain-containing protein [Methanocella sp. MCL-LM]|uniref:double zinc ribbon domain-containing protein n=1 Tax=Methanocella sp. MCL-LM TaxID=3412035 RepID=UPI003C730A6F
MALLPQANAAGGVVLPSDLQVTKVTVTPDIYHPGLITLDKYNVAVTADQSTIAADGHAMVIAKVTWAANDSPAAGVTVEFTSAPASGTFEPVASSTASFTIVGRISKGQAKADFTSSAPGTYTITAQSYRTYISPSHPDNVKDAAGTVTLVVEAPPATSTPTVTPEPATPTPDPATPTPPVVVGGVTDTPTPSPVVVTVTPDPGTGAGLTLLADYWMYIAIALAILLLLFLLLLFLWLKSSLQVLPKKTRVPADGTSKLPIRVQFVNGLGMVKRMGRDTDVEFETTAGTINSAVIPQGKDHVDVDLTSSREFGPVTVTTKALGKTATTRVDFVVEHGSLDVTVQPSTIPADGASSATVTVAIKDEKGGFVTPLEDKTVTLKSTLGTIAPELKLPGRVQSASTVITSGDVSGTAVIVAAIGNMHGEGKVEFKGMPKRFCMHCGTPMSLEASQCPKCGKTPPSGTDVKQCPSCSTVIPEAARFCHHCGAMQPENKK